ncbi:MAG: NUDIX domain-containing protein [Treponema sp.]
MSTFNFCPKCGSKSISYVDSKKWVCPDCGFTLYNNIASAVAVVIADEYGGVLLETRAKEPRKGFLALPGGFTDRDETAEQAAMRECFEETGLKLESVEYLCSFPNDYEYKNIAYKTCDIFFTAALPKKFGTIGQLITTLEKQTGEVSGFSEVRITSEEELAKVPLAFTSAKETLKLWLEKTRG